MVFNIIIKDFRRNSVKARTQYIDLYLYFFIYNRSQ